MGRTDRDPPETDNPPLVIWSLKQSEHANMHYPPFRRSTLDSWAARIIILVLFANVFETQRDSEVQNVHNLGLWINQLMDKASWSIGCPWTISFVPIRGPRTGTIAQMRWCMNIGPMGWLRVWPLVQWYHGRGVLVNRAVQGSRVHPVEKIEQII